MQVNPQDMLLFTAANFAAEKHKHQLRKGDGSSYIVHPLGVAKILMDEGDIVEPNVLIAAILHDTLEDTKTTPEEITELFGQEVTNIVKDVTDDKSQSKDDRKRKQVEKSSHLPVYSKLVKMADKLHNLRDLLVVPPKGWSVERIRGYFVWAFSVVKGLRGINEKLESKLDQVFQSTICHEGQYLSVLPPPEEREQYLEKYYQSMSVVKD